MIKVKRNPHLDDIEEFIKNNSIEFQYLNEGVEGKVFYFRLNKRLVLNTKILQPGEYVLKVFFDTYKYSENDIKLYLLISKYGLIPKVYLITKKYIVMKYINGIRLSDFLNKSKNTYISKIPISDRKEIKYKLMDRVEELYEIWRKLGLDEHVDPSEDNILVSNNFEHVYIIDPFLHD